MDILKQLGIEPGAILINAIGFVLLYWVLAKYAFGPIGEFIADRREAIAKSMRDAEAAKQGAQQQLAEVAERRQELLAQAAQEAEAARTKSRSEAEELLEKARQQVRERELQAQKSVSDAEEQVRTELRGEVSGLAVDFCERLLQQSLDAERHQALMDKFIQDVEKMASSRGGA